MVEFAWASEWEEVELEALTPDLDDSRGRLQKRLFNRIESGQEQTQEKQ